MYVATKRMNLENSRTILMASAVRGLTVKFLNNNNFYLLISISYNSGIPNICHYIIFNKGYTRMSRINISLITTVSPNVLLQIESLQMSNGSHRVVLTTK